MKRICIVDDDQAVRDSLSAFLETCGYHAVSFTSAEDFLVRCDGGKNYCLLIDVHMPGMNGLDLVDALRTRGVNTPAILITAAANALLRARAETLGVSDLLEKPIEGDALLAAIEKAGEQ